jgi:hypothetical protein
VNRFTGCQIDFSPRVRSVGSDGKQGEEGNEGQAHDVS